MNLIGCVLCGRHDLAAAEEVCGRCRKAYAPTPLDVALDALGMSETDLSEATGIPRRTVIRAARGERMSARVARRLADLTGFPASAFRPEVMSDGTEE